MQCSGEHYTTSHKHGWQSTTNTHSQHDSYNTVRVVSLCLHHAGAWLEQIFYKYLATRIHLGSS